MLGARERRVNRFLPDLCSQDFISWLETVDKTVTTTTAAANLNSRL